MLVAPAEAARGGRKAEAASDGAISGPVGTAAGATAAAVDGVALVDDEEEDHALAFETSAISIGAGAGAPVSGVATAAETVVPSAVGAVAVVTVVPSAVAGVAVAAVVPTAVAGVATVVPTAVAAVAAVVPEAIVASAAPALAAPVPSPTPAASADGVGSLGMRSGSDRVTTGGALSLAPLTSLCSRCRRPWSG